MRQFYILILFTGFLLVSGCGSGGEDYEQIAREACDCIRPLFESYNDLKAAQEDNDSEALQRFAEEMEAANEEVSACADRIEERYGVLEGEREEQVKAAMQKICPEVIQTLNEAERALVQ